MQRKFGNGSPGRDLRYIIGHDIPCGMKDCHKFMTHRVLTLTRD